MQQRTCRRSKEACVRAFSPSQERYPNRSLEEAEELERDGLVRAHRTKRGVIRSIVFFGEIAPSFWNRYKPGTRYSFQEQCAGRKVWTHRRLPSVPVDRGLCESEVAEHRDVAQRAAFAGVTLSIQAASEPPPPGALSIADIRNTEHETQAEEFAQAA
jgi:hypothetical protein